MVRLARLVGPERVVASTDCGFAQGPFALSECSFTAEPGQVHAVIGPNGAGKSTLFNALCGIYRPAAGSIRLDGTELVGRRPDSVAALGVGRAFQNSSMVAGLSVADNLLLGRHRLTRSGLLSTGLRLPRARHEERDARLRVREVAAFLGTEELLALPAAELAYGAQKRVDIARALCTEPRLLLLDEPAAGMPAHEKVAMRDTVRRIAVDLGMTVLLVEHDMGLVMSISDRVTVLDFGTVIAGGTPTQIRTDPEVIRAYLGRAHGDAASLLDEPTG
ncbi:MAG: ATP-binding cassette domain-containing protein [Pseudonocardiaceae bacterium]|nr:ATP-binding cassette domain-containing protein [Pseudonocardiaceae bacterium]